MLSTSNPELVKTELDQVLTQKQILFSNVDLFPAYRGLYYLYNKSDLTLLYIGSVYGKDRSIKDRCNQYIIKGKGGDSFRGKISILKKLSDEKTIKYIKENVYAKFVNLESIDEQSIRQIEQVAIWAYQPTLNFILNKFSYEDLNITFE
jgi:hypothetical protein